MARGKAFRSAWWACVGSILLACMACGTTVLTGSGHVVSKRFAVTSFSRIQVSSAFVTNVSVGEEAGLLVRVDDNLVDRLDVGVSGETLHIGLKSHLSVRRATLEADVLVRSLSALDLSGASQAHLAGPLEGQRLELTLSGASRLDGRVSFGEIDAGLSGASQAHLAGTAGRLLIEASGASRIDSIDLQARDLDVTLSGASRTTISVSDTVAAELSGASQLHYKGSPVFTKKDVSGASIIEPA